MPVRRPSTAKLGSSASARLRALRLRVRQLEAERDGLAKRLANAKRRADRKLAAMMNEIAQLRHHEARAAALQRLVAEREAAIAGQAERLRALESNV